MDTLDVLDRMIPVSTLNHGGASKVINELADDKPAVIVKNNKPAAVLLTPADYRRMAEALEDYSLYLSAQQRDAESDGTTYSPEEVFGKNYVPVDDGYEPEFE